MPSSGYQVNRICRECGHRAVGNDDRGSLFGPPGMCCGCGCGDRGYIVFLRVRERRCGPWWRRRWEQHPDDAAGDGITDLPALLVGER